MLQYSIQEHLKLQLIWKKLLEKIKIKYLQLNLKSFEIDIYSGKNAHARVLVIGFL